MCLHLRPHWRRSATPARLGYFVGTRRFSSSSQFWTTTRLMGTAVWSAPALISRNRRPSSDYIVCPAALAGCGPVASQQLGRRGRRPGRPMRHADAHDGPRLVQIKQLLTFLAYSGRVPPSVDTCQ